MSKRKRIKFDFWTVTTIIIALIFTIFLVYPLFSLFFSGFKDPSTGELTLANFAKFFSKKKSTPNFYKIFIAYFS